MARRRASRAGSARRRRAARPSTRACTPCPGIAWNSLAGGIAHARAPRRSLTIARATGCSASRSTAAARRSASSCATVAGRAHRDDAVLAERERARLVEHDGRQVARLLEAAPVAHEQAVPRAERRRDRDDERNREPERVRAGDDEHRHDPLDRERGVGAGARARRSSVTSAGAERDDREAERRAVGERLRAGARLLRLRDEPHDAGERGALARAASPRRAASRRRSPCRRSPRRPACFSTGRDSPVIIDSLTRAASLAHDAVGGHARAGPNEHEVALAQRARSARRPGVRPRARVAVFGSSFASSCSAPCACVIERISIQWPSSMIVTSVASSPRAASPGKPSVTATLNTNATRDRERDQRHHPRQAVGELAPRAVAGTPSRRRRTPPCRRRPGSTARRARRAA